MADRQIDPAGCLGRVLTLLGIIWLGVVVFTGVFGLRDNAGSMGAVIGSTLPALLLLAAGRVLSRRAAERKAAPALPPPTARPSRSSTAETEPPPPPQEVFPRPAKTAPPPSPEPELPAELPPPPIPSPPKTSQEMIEEARKRWGTGPRPGNDGI